MHLEEKQYRIFTLKLRLRLWLKARHSYTVECLVNAFKIPAEKEDLWAMYLACKTNMWYTKERMVFSEMKELFGDDPRIKEIVEKKKEEEKHRRVVIIVVLSFALVFSVLLILLG